MREAIGGSMLLYIVIFFASIVMLMFVGILSYSKAYKVKNRIIEAIEKYEDYSLAVDEINSDLATMGYALMETDCGSDNLNTTNYAYCVYKVCNKEETKDGTTTCVGTYYYKVRTFMTFEFPVINSIVKFQVKGETRTLGKNFDYE